MPIALDGETVDYVLENDRDKAEEIRPAFVCRYLTVKQILQYERIIKSAHEAKDNAGTNEHLTAALMLMVSGWKNFTAPFSAEAMDEVLTADEKWEIAYGANVAVRLSEMDKKKSRSKSLATGESSAPSATAENALTPPASASQK